MAVALALVAAEAASARIAGISGAGFEHPPEADFRDVYGPRGLAYRAAWFREETDAERDRQYALANQYGVFILPILLQTYRPRTQTQMDEWLAYVRHVVQRYPAQGYWEIWNEPNADWSSSGDYDFYGEPAAWGTFVQATTKAIRGTKAGRNDTVVAGAFALDVPGWEAFVDQSFTSQAISVHTYASPDTAVARINAADARTDKPIWITEISWPENGSGNQAANTGYVLERTPGKPYFHFTLHEFDGTNWPKELAATPATLDLLQRAAAGATTFPTAPVAETGSATAIADTSATLSGSVNPANQQTKYHFEYGRSTAYGSNTAEQTLSATDNTSHSVSASLSGLTPGATYHYRLVAANSTGTTEGKDQTFTTRNASTTIYRSSVLATNGLVGYWRLGEQSGTTAADEKSTNPGTYSGGYTLGQPSALATDSSNTSVGFDGVGGEMSTGGPALGSSGSLEGWFNWQNGTALMRDGTSAAGTGWILAYDSGGNLYYRLGGTSFNTGRTTASVRNGWHHFVATKNGGNVAFYLDGQPVHSASGAGSTAPTMPWHVMRNGSYSQFTQGGADEVAVYDVALSAATVQQHYNAGLDNNGNGPSATTGSATNVTSASATLNGTVNPNGQSTTYYFQYGTTTSYGSQTASQSAGSGTSDVPASANLSGLTGATAYHYRLVASSSAGTTYGSDRTFTTSSAYRGTITGTAGLVSYWRLGESVGPLAADEQSANPGTYSGTYTLAEPGALTGDSNTSVKLDGTSGYVNLSPTPFGTPSNFSVEAWIKLDAQKGTGGKHTIVTDSFDDYNDGFSFSVDDLNKLSLTVASNSTTKSVASSASALALNTWYHVVGTYDGAAVRLYINGSLDSSTAYSSGITYNSSRDLQLGKQVKSFNQSIRFLDGALDEVALYSTALSAATVQQHYNAGKGS